MRTGLTSGPSAAEKKANDKKTAAANAKRYSQKVITGGSQNTYNVASGRNVTLDNGKLYENGISYSLNESNGRYESHTGARNYYTLGDVNPPPAAAAAPSAPARSSGGGGGSSRPSGGTASYGTTNPSAGNTGSQPLDATTAALMEMIASLTASIADKPKIDASDVSKPAGAGLASTILTNSYIPSSEKKKKSYLTPIAVG